MAEGPSAASEYLQKLHQKAVIYCRQGFLLPVPTFYRNNSSSYFDDIQENNNIMEAKLKDDGGDPLSPINGKLYGVFLGVTRRKSASSKVYRLPTKSPFGDTRVLVPLERLFNESARLYFADFYCMECQRDNHYITLVLTKPDTKEDLFCQEHLIRLDESNNGFLDKVESGHETIQREEVWVEVFYTNEVDISVLDQCKTKVLGIGSSSRGIRKRSDCNICNVAL